MCKERQYLVGIMQELECTSCLNNRMNTKRIKSREAKTTEQSSLLNHAIDGLQSFPFLGLGERKKWKK